MSEKFQYTDSFSPASELIDSVYYNANTEEALVKFVYGDESIYTDFSQDTYQDWAAARSAGGFWHSDVKGVYDYSDNEFDGEQFVTVNTVVVNAPLTVSGASDYAFSDNSLRALNLSGVALNDYTVHWTLQGTKREAKVSAPNEDKAIETFNWAAELMDLTEFAKIKAVTRHFV